MTLALIALMICILSAFFDTICYLIFCRISIRKQKGKVLIFTFLNIIFGLTAIINSPLIAELFLIFVSYILFNKLEKYLLFGAALIPLTVDLILDIIMEIVHYYLSIKSTFLLALIYYLVAFILIYSAKNKIYNVLTSKNKKLYFFLFLYFFITVLCLYLINYYLKTRFSYVIVLSSLLIVQTIFTITILHFVLRLQKELLSKQVQKQKQKEHLQLKEYASYLESGEDDLRKFRHDYRNMLNSLRVSIQDGNAEEALEKLNQYTNTNLNSKALLKYKDVNHIHVTSLKSIIITKLSELYSLGIPYNFECRHRLSSLPDKLDEFDLIRLIGISLDNAIEESKKIIEQTGNKENAEIQIMIYASDPGVLELEIRNKVLEKIKSINKLQAKGYTTKKGHAGLGLANIAELEDKYPEMSISYTIQDDYFDFYMMFDDTEDGE